APRSRGAIALRRTMGQRVRDCRCQRRSLSAAPPFRRRDAARRVPGPRDQIASSTQSISASLPEDAYCTAMRVVVLGAGVGGLELTTRLSDDFGAAADVVLVDQ